MRLLDVQQNTPEWEDLRKTKIGASDAASILGISPWMTAFQCWQSKKGKKTEVNYSMKRGTALEEKAREAFEIQHGLLTIPRVVESRQNEWQIASLDGLTFEMDTFVEFKCPKKEVVDMAKEGLIPDYYKSQLQHQLCVTGLQECFYYAFDGEVGYTVSVKRDQNFIDMLLEAENEFYKGMINDIPPPLSSKDYVQREDLGWEEHAKTYISIHNQINSLEKELERVKTILIEEAKDQNTKGSGISVSFEYRKGVVDTKKIERDLHINLEAYRKEGSFIRKILIDRKTIS